jgi:hypothetical protein
MQSSHPNPFDGGCASRVGLGIFKTTLASKGKREDQLCLLQWLQQAKSEIPMTILLSRPKESFLDIL